MNKEHSQEAEFNPEEIPHANEVWLIDDGGKVIEGLADQLRHGIEDTGFEVKIFSTGKEALEELGSRAKDNLGSPHFIISDGGLEQDDKAINSGPLAMQEIQKLKIRQPEFLGFSSTKDINKEMKDLGASATFGKDKIDDITQHIIKQIKDKKQ